MLVHCVVKYSRPPDLNSASHLLELQGPQQTSAIEDFKSLRFDYFNIPLLKHIVRIEDFKEAHRGF